MDTPRPSPRTNWTRCAPQQAGQGQGPDFVSLYDFVDTSSVVVYGRVFRLAACNRFTADFFAANGLPLSVSPLACGVRPAVSPGICAA